MKLKFLKISVFIVTLEALRDAGFKGFNLQAREIEGDGPVGTFKITDPNTKGLECHNMTVCVHSFEYLHKLGFLLNTLIDVIKEVSIFNGSNISSVELNLDSLKKCIYLLHMIQI